MGAFYGTTPQAVSITLDGQDARATLSLARHEALSRALTAVAFPFRYQTING